MTTLQGSKELNVVDESGASHVVNVRQLPLRDYDKAIAALGDEFELAAVVCEKPKDFITSLTPESFELLNTAVEETNKSFFAWSTRQQDKQARRLNSFNPEILKAAATAMKASNATPPGSRPHAS